MKKLAMFALVALAAALSVHAQQGLLPGNMLEGIDPDKRAALMAKKAARLARAGGIVERQSTGNVVRVVNNQKFLSEAVLKKHLEMFEMLIRMPVVFGEADNAGVTITLSGDAKTPAVLVAPEEGWAIVNIGTLAKDKPSEELLASRFEKEFWRASAMTVGAYVSMFQPCLMQIITDVKQLDAIHLNGPSPEVLNKMVNGARRFGILPRDRATYRTACIEGWAPPPTNDVQKAIWEKVLADKEKGPSNPIKIEPPKK